MQQHGGAYASGHAAGGALRPCPQAEVALTGAWYHPGGIHSRAVTPARGVNKSMVHCSPLLPCTAGSQLCDVGFPLGAQGIVGAGGFKHP